jgi:tRNA threonylcarbamoyladenosine biosynthesis protein TsaE
MNYKTTNSKQTQKMGEILAQELRGGEIICLTGDLGSGKTTFAQGILKGLGLKGAFVSPTFMIMKQYKVKIQKSASPSQGGSKVKNASKNLKVSNIFHIDCYRVNYKDILNLGWEEIIADPKNIVIIEWAERIKKIIPKDTVWIEFDWKGENEREIILKNF